MAVTNFWVDARIMGRATALTGGPQGKEQGLTIVLKQRDRGGIVTALIIECDAQPDGKLITTIEPQYDEIKVTTKGSRIVLTSMR